MNTPRFFAFIKQKEVFAFSVALFCTYLLIPILFENEVYPMYSGGPSWATLDISWRITLNKINIDHLTWGKDFTFTYGPLSYLSTRIGWGESKWHFILFDIFVAFNFFYIFYTALVKTNNRKITLFVIVAATVLVPPVFGAGTAIVLFALLIFWIRQGLEQSKLFFYVMQTLLIVLVFYIKFNTGLISFILFFAALAYKFLFTKENKWLLLGITAAPVFLVFVFAGILHVALWDYLLGGLNMVSGYNEIMRRDEGHVTEYEFAVILLLMALSILGLKIIAERKQTLAKNLTILFIFSTAVYVLYKQAFTRADMEHIMDLFKYVLVFIVCLRDFHYTETGRYSNSLVVLIVVIAFFFGKRKDEPFALFSDKISKNGYIDGMKRFTDSSGIFLFPNDHQIRKVVRDRIGNATTDIYPWCTHLLFENRIHYTPRPAFQSYTAYTPYLENLNFDFYNSSKAPQYMLYECEAVDDRYPVFDEPKLHLALLKNYTCVDTFGMSNRPVLVLKKNKSVSKVSLTKLKEYEAGINDVIVPEQSMFYEVFVSNSLKGKLTSLLYRSPELFLVIRLKDNSERVYKTSTKLLESGIFSDRLFSSTLDFYNFIKKDSASIIPNIKNYSLRFKDASMFHNKIKIRAYKIN